MTKKLNFVAGHFIQLISGTAFIANADIQASVLKIGKHIHKFKEHSFPPLLLHSLIAIEDRRYYFHCGVDFISVLRALYKNISTSRREGASTITQQFVRTVTNAREITVKRKIKEIIIASVLERRYSKKEIITAYISSYVFQNSKDIFGFCNNEKIDLRNATQTDCAIVAARFKYPSLSTKNYISYLKRVRSIEILTEKIKVNHAFLF